MTKTQNEAIREVFNVICNEMQLTFDSVSADELYSALSTGESDIKIDIDGQELRIIHSDDIDRIQEEELGDDLYILGCFNSSFLADATGIDFSVIAALQEAEAFEALGRLIIDQKCLGDIQEQYAAFDGYGHHFGHYDGNEYEAGNWYIFRTN